MIASSAPSCIGRGGATARPLRHVQIERSTVVFPCELAPVIGTIAPSGRISVALSRAKLETFNSTIFTAHLLCECAPRPLSPEVSLYAVTATHRENRI